MAERLDVYLVKTGRFPSRAKAAQAIEAGRVRINGRAAKPADRVGELDKIEIEAAEEYVGRGAYKLLAAVERFGIRLEGRVCLDVGASTGGFTEVMLRAGAAKVYAVDVGSGQLAKTLADDPRVVNLEKTDVRRLDSSLLEPKPDFFTLDVSFIPLMHVLPAVAGLVSQPFEGVALIKPQFEAGREYVGKNGIVKNPAGRRRAIENAATAFEKSGMALAGLIRSPIAGGDGNIEYLACLKSGGGGVEIDMGIVF